MHLRDDPRGKAESDKEEQARGKARPCDREGHRRGPWRLIAAAHRRETWGTRTRAISPKGELPTNSLCATHWSRAASRSRETLGG